MEKIKVILIGAGNRGLTYTTYMKGEKFQVVAVAEPNDIRRHRIKDTHGLSEDMCFTSWEDLLSKPKFADVVVIATGDRQHYEPAMKAISLGYNLLLEKPIAPTYQECVDIANFAKEKGVKILVCHVLRYTKFFRKIKDMINEGLLGEVLSIHHNEAVGHIHHSHSYVRGNWGNSVKSAPMLLAKSCHDIDIIQWLMNSKCTKVQSFGSLSYFKRKNAPEGSPERCIDGCPHSENCVYDATKIYCTKNKGWYKWHALQKHNATDDDYAELMRNTQYGKCIFKCDNDVVDHQVVNMEFENGGVASFNMSSFNEGGRFIRVMGTAGEIYGNMHTNTLDYYNFKTGEHTIINPNEHDIDDSIVSGHGGGDEGIVRILHKYLTEDYNGDMLSEIGISTENHLTVFAAEKSRAEGTVVCMNDFLNKIGLK